MIRDFRNFLFRGNIVELAVALVIARAGDAGAAAARSGRGGMPDEERRHRELLATLQGLPR